MDAYRINFNSSRKTPVGDTILSIELVGEDGSVKHAVDFVQEVPWEAGDCFHVLDVAIGALKRQV